MTLSDSDARQRCSQALPRPQWYQFLRADPAGALPWLGGEHFPGMMTLSDREPLVSGFLDLNEFGYK